MNSVTTKQTNEREIIGRGIAGEVDAEERDRRHLQGCLRAAGNGRNLHDDEVDDVLHGERRHGEIDALHAQRGGAKHRCRSKR
jgi:hypothetical protein